MWAAARVNELSRRKMRFAHSLGTLQIVTLNGKHFVTIGGASFYTVCAVDRPWRDLRGTWERLRWARLKAGFEKAKDAADSLGVKPGTYRTYECDPTSEGREAPLSEYQRFARKYKVNWVWLVSGEGSPEDGAFGDERLRALAQKSGEVPEDKRDDALNAALSVLESYARRAG